jgi:hypothetical protein
MAVDHHARARCRTRLIADLGYCAESAGDQRARDSGGQGWFHFCFVVSRLPRSVCELGLLQASAIGLRPGWPASALPLPGVARVAGAPAAGDARGSSQGQPRVPWRRRGLMVVKEGRL